MIDIYGIPNCDTIKKARKWLDVRGLVYTFHDYKKEGVDPEKLRGWVSVAGWEAVLNRAGTTFRKLDDADKADLNAEKAVTIMVANPSCIKRPVLVYPGGVLVGFKEAVWADALLA